MYRTLERFHSYALHDCQGFCDHWYIDEAHVRLIFNQTIQRKVEKGVKIRILQLVILIKR